jgi:hypothetical protein
MLDGDQWRELIAPELARGRNGVKARDYLREQPENSFAKPPLLKCNDDQEYWVKFPLGDTVGDATARRERVRSLVIDHVVGRLAHLLRVEAVPPVQLVQIPDELIKRTARLASARAGWAHGSKNTGPLTQKIVDFAYEGYYRNPMNRPRFAALAVLYGLARGDDRHVNFPHTGKPLVFSVDHGEFLYGPGWKATDLIDAKHATVDETIRRVCRVTPLELAEPLERLRALTVFGVAAAVSMPPCDWSFPESDRIALAKYIWERREAIICSES